LGTITILTNFNARKRMLKQKTIIILTTHMSKAFHRSEAQSKCILDVSILQLAPSMTIVLSIHAL
jgi:hypothetical protein